MADRTYVYVDGESHFIRSLEAWKSLRGQNACLEDLRYIGQNDDGLTLVNTKAKVFWTRKMNPGADRAVYFTSLVGDGPTMHDVQVALRNFELEPYVVPERKNLSAQRANALQTQNIIEKPKGVDISLAVRMIEDSWNKVFDTCHLYTSDIDFLPVVQAVRARGMKVYVHGYKDGLAIQSPFLHTPDGFVDLGEVLRDQCELVSTGGY